MNDSEIRINFHRKKLLKHHIDNDTLVVNELGLNHGKCRADIAVINGQLIGFEIKSDSDSLLRLKEQVKSYNEIFDKLYIIVGSRYANTIHKHLPDWWGVIIADKGLRSATRFALNRKAKMNQSINPVSLARLLWRDEVVVILKQRNISPRLLRQPRTILYEHLANILSLNELRKTVRTYLKKRENWRCPESLLLYDD